MPALNFQTQFAPAVEHGEKCQTIRAYRDWSVRILRYGSR